MTAFSFETPIPLRGVKDIRRGEGRNERGRASGL